MNRTASILLVDDYISMQSSVVQLLRSAGYQVLTARDGYEALELLETNPVDLILADIVMPRMNGYQLHQRISANPKWVGIPFLFLTGRSLDSDIRYGKELGVDDYLLKPIDLEDLLATVRGRLRRARQLANLKEPASSLSAKPEADAFTFGQLRIDFSSHQAWRNGRQIKLSAKEFALLACLARQVNSVVSLPDLINATHNLKTDKGEAGVLLRPLIRSLRRKLGYGAGEMGCIESVRGVGYRLVVP